MKRYLVGLKNAADWPGRIDGVSIFDSLEEAQASCSLWPGLVVYECEISLFQPN